MSKLAILITVLFITALLGFLAILGVSIYEKRDVIGGTQIRLVCESGYMTPWSGTAYIDNGDMVWSVGKDYSYRRMEAGEVCHQEKRIEPQL